MSASIHTVPVPEDEHVCDGLMCWCVPRYYLPCDECGHAESLDDIAEEYDASRLHAFPDDLRAAPGVVGCWKCTDGLIELSVAEAESCDRALLIVHNR